MKPSSRIPSIESLQAFEALVRLGRVEAAARELSITSSAVAKRIALLEQILGEPLFDRMGRERQLTAAGKGYLESIRAVLAQLTAIGLHRRQQQLRPRLRVLSPPTFAREVIVPALTSFPTPPDQLDLELLVAIPYLDTNLPEVDVTVSFGPLPATASVADSSGQVSDVALLAEPCFVVASPVFVRRHRLRRVEDLTRLPLIRCPIEPWRPWCRAAGLGDYEPDVGMRLVDLGLALEAAAAHQGLALARPSIARRWLERGELLDVFPHVRAEAGTGYRMRIQHASAATLGFAQWLTARCRLLTETMPAGQPGKTPRAKKEKNS